jgi:hypothetical protein
MPLDSSLSLDAFIRTIKINRKSPHAVFLGAGASISSNVIPASTCIWHWKSEIFQSNVPGMAHHIHDLALSSIQEKIQKWLNTEGGYPTLNAPEEYSFYVERCYPSPTARRQFFQNLIARAVPHVSYHLLCKLAEEGIIRSVWTTNFDQLAARAAAHSEVTPIEIGLDTPDRVVRFPQEGELLCVALHGDYRYDALKNTEAELRHQDEKLRTDLVRHLTDFSLIVIGYSGRDHSIMQALTEVYSKPGAGILYWCGYGDVEPPQAVQALIDTARSHNREAYYVPTGTGGFDDVIHRLAMQCLTEERLSRAIELYSEAASRNDAKSPPFVVAGQKPVAFIKSNAFKIECPHEVYQFDSSYLRTAGAWQKLRELTKGTQVIAGLLRQKVLAIGNLEEIKAVFKDKIDDKITAIPITESELAMEEGVIVGLFRQAIVSALTAIHNFETDHNHFIWQKDFISGKLYQHSGITYRLHNAVKLTLRWYTGKPFVVLEPTLKLIGDAGERPPKELVKKVVNAELSSQYNSAFSKQLNAWLDTLLPKDQEGFSFPPSTESIFKFKVTRSAACATISSNYGKPINVSAVQRFTVWEGTEFQEPELIFSNQQGTGFVKDINPIRGIARHQPYDYVRHNSVIGREIRLGVICPATDDRKLHQHLAKLHQSIRPTSTPEYLLEYPGFAQAFGLPIEIPSPGSSQWMTCPELDAGLEVKNGALQLRRNLVSCIDRLQATTPPHVILIYIPDRWAAWKRYDLGGETFDLHDFVKAHCVQKGIATQFLEEDTLSYNDPGRIMWFQALALYAKAMRTPWILDSIDRDTAFIGLGYSQSPNAPSGKQIILGCSHLYSPEGVGLSYRLSKIEDPIFDKDDRRQRNPFMSVDDARRVGESTRQLFFQSGMGLPKRVVIHKRTPFRTEEKQGLLQGLSGIPNVDMVELTLEPDLKFVQSIMKNNIFEPDMFPIRRGTAVRLDDRKALLWVHGTTPAVDANRRFYLGKRRIPTPLVITRHYGTSSLSTLSREILGLSKMNWNNFEMYSKLPATIDSSNAIARIGALLERYGTALHDYRLFM